MDNKTTCKNCGKEYGYHFGERCTTLIENTTMFEPVNDNINHPAHYTSKTGVECIQVTEQFNFNRGNAIKYIWRAGEKNPEKEIEDLEKAVWYVNREITRLQTEGQHGK